MYVSEIDWRIGSLHDIIVGIHASLAEVREYFEGGRAEERIDGLNDEWTELGQMEPITGLGFVAFQTYALGTWTDLNRIRENPGKPPVEIV
jgi:hypothetical protein